MNIFATADDIEDFHRSVNDADKFLKNDRALEFLTRRQYTSYCISILDRTFPHAGTEVPKSELIEELASLASFDSGDAFLRAFVKDTDGKSDHEIAMEIYKQLLTPGGNAHAYGWLIEHIDQQTQRYMVGVSSDGEDAREVYHALRDRSRRLSSESTKSAVGKLHKFVTEAAIDRTQAIKNVEAEIARKELELKRLKDRRKMLLSGGTIEEASTEVLSDYLISAVKELDGVPEEIAKLAREENAVIGEIRRDVTGTDDEFENVISKYVDGYQMRVYEGPNSLGYRTALELLYSSLEKDGTIAQMESMLASNNIADELKPLIQTALRRIEACRMSIGLMVKINTAGTSLMTYIMTMRSTGLWREEAETISTAIKRLKEIYEKGNTLSLILPYGRIRKELYSYRQIEPKEEPPVPIELTEDAKPDEEQEKLIRLRERFYRAGSCKRLLSICKTSPIITDDGYIDLAASFNNANTGDVKLLQDICDTAIEFFEDKNVPLTEWIFETESGKKMGLTLPSIQIDAETFELKLKKNSTPKEDGSV